MVNNDLDIDKQKKYDEMKKRYLDVSKSEVPKKQPLSQSEVPKKQPLPQSHSEIITSLENQLKNKQDTIKELNSKKILSDLENKKQQLDDNLISKKQHIQELRSNLQILQKQIIQSIQEIRIETDQKINELSSTNSQISQLAEEENELVEKIHDAQKLRASQEKELESLRLERLNIVNKNKDTQKIQEHILQYRNRLDQITSDRAMLELEIKSQMNFLEEEHQKEREIISKIISQYKN